MITFLDSLLNYPLQNFVDAVNLVCLEYEINMRSVSERGRQGRHKLKTQLNRLLKHWCNCVTESTCIHFVYSKFIPSPQTVHHMRNEGHIERVVKFKLTSFFGEKFPYL